MSEKQALVPRLRFPEFRGAGEWNNFKLTQISERLQEKVGSRKLTTVSITAGFGFVSQVEKFGRDISGEQYKNYILLKHGEFSYNKGNSKAFPQGCIYQLDEFNKVAAPSAFISFKFNSDFVPEFFKGYFDSNFHGYQLLRFITSGARSDGLLNISPAHFFSIRLPTPQSKGEQQKIADCLSSLDTLIAAQAEKIDALKTHKKGLMQQLFPREGETVPRLRFPEFRDAGEWEVKALEDLAKVTSGGTPNRTEPAYWGGSIPWVTTSLINFNRIDSVEEFITNEGLNNSSAKLFPAKTLLMAMYGQGKTRGKVALLGIEATTNQACAAIMFNDEVDTNFAFQNLASRYDEIRKLSNEGGQENLSAGLIKNIYLSHPCLAEQQKIADCLTSLDALIAAQVEKLDALKTHKKGLMQQLFPSPEAVI